MADLIEVVKVLNVLYIAYPKHTGKLSDRQVEQANDLYARLLGDLDPVLLKAAAEQHIAESEWFPTVAELRNRAHTLTQIGRQIVSAEEAWGTVIRAAGALGRETPQDRLRKHFADKHGEEAAKLMGRAVESVGWRDICLSDESHLGVIRAHFYRTYEAFEKREATEAKLLPEVRSVVSGLAAHFTRHQLNGKTTEAVPE